MPPLSKAKILAANDVTTETIDVPEWGGEVVIKTLSGVERDQFEDSYRAEETKSFRQRFLVLCLCDAKGVRLFSDKEIDALGEKNANVINRLFEKAWAFNAFRTEDVDSLGEGLPSDQKDSSTSD
jgi:hypothetical protein